MDLRFYIDPQTGEPHLYRHGVSEDEAEDVLARPLEDRPGRDGARVALGQTRGGRYLRVVYVPDPTPRVGVRDHGLRPGTHRLARPAAPQEEIMKQSRYPAGWDETRVRGVLTHYETQRPDEAVAEDDAAYASTTHTAMEVPVELVPAVRELLAQRRAS